MYIFHHNSTDHFSPRQLNRIILQFDRNQILIQLLLENFGTGVHSIRKLPSIFTNIDRNSQLTIKDNY
jgi:hypothetical protein